jgi:hypothetical protein
MLRGAFGSGPWSADCFGTPKQMAGVRLRALERWLCDGVVDDPHSEFMVTENKVRFAPGRKGCTLSYCTTGAPDRSCSAASGRPLIQRCRAAWVGVSPRPVDSAAADGADALFPSRRQLLGIRGRRPFSPVTGDAQRPGFGQARVTDRPAPSGQRAGQLRKCPPPVF